MENIMRSIYLQLILLCTSLVGFAQSTLERGAYAIINDATIEVVCDSPISAVKKETFTVTILNSKGSDIANFSCMCDKFSSLRKFSGEVIDKNGKIIRRIKQSDLTMSEYSSGLTSDDYMYYYECTLPSFPVTVRYEWEVKYKDGLIGFPTFVPQNRYNVAVEKSSYSLSTPEGFDCRHKVVNSAAEVLQKKAANGKLVTTATLNALPALELEDYGAPLDKRIPCIFFAPTHFSFDGHKGNLSTWQTYGQWQYDLLDGRDELPETVKDRIREITAPHTSDFDKTKALYAYLAESTRYVSIQLGIGGLQPIKASEVNRTGFGDCKGLSNYLKAMLNVIGIPSNYTVISTVSPDLLEDYASANQMNHVILQVPLHEQTLWLECTNPELPFGYIHEGIAGHQALLVTPKGGELVRLPLYPDTLNKQDKTVKIALQADGSAQLSVNEVSSLFQYEDLRGISRIEAGRQKDYLRNKVNLSNATIDQIQILERRELCPQIDISYRVQTGQYGNKTGNRLFIPINVFRQGLRLPAKDERQQDIHINYGYLDTDSISIDIPEGFVIEALPHPVHIEKEFGTFSSTITVEGNEIKATHQFLMRRGIYTKDSYEDFLKFRKAMVEQYAAQVVLRKAT